MEQYIKFMNDYRGNNGDCVLFSSLLSSSTKLRVVCDASHKTTTGISPNDKRFIGPERQENLTSIIVRWRQHKVALLDDIKYVSADCDCRCRQRLW